MRVGMIVVSILFIVIIQQNVKSNMKVYAKESAYTVEFVANGGKGTMKLQKIVFDRKSTLKKCTFYRKGYIFVGWSVSKNGKIKYKNKAKVKNLTLSGKKIKLYARWKKDGVRRALILGHTTKSAIQIDTLLAIGRMMTHSLFYGKTMKQVEFYPNHTGFEINERFKNTFKDTKQNDISYIYIVCHSNRYGEMYIGTDGGYCTPAELRKLCDDNIKGTVVVMIESCFAGSVIGQSIPQKENDAMDCSEQILNEFIKTSSDNNATLTTSKYKVICSSRKDETSMGGSISLATKYWSLGGGWNQDRNKKCKLNADANKDNQVTLKELYNYSYKKVKKENPNQHICVYPENSGFVIFGRFKY